MAFVMSSVANVSVAAAVAPAAAARGASGLKQASPTSVSFTNGKHGYLVAAGGYGCLVTVVDTV